jgi:membrane-bound ClpP family serine protease
MTSLNMLAACAIIPVSVGMGMKRNIVDCLKVAATLWDDILLTLLVLLALYLLDVRFSWYIILAVFMFFIAFALVMHRLLVPMFRKKIITGREELVGQEGEVVQPLSPKGLVRLKGEYWKATCAGESLDKGVTTEVIGLDGLTIIVRRIGRT